MVESLQYTFTMSYSVVYSNGGPSPYEEWLHTFKNDHACMRFIDNKIGAFSSLRSTCIPSTQLLYVECELAYWSMEATLRLNICHVQKRVEVIAVSCQSRTYWENFYPSAPIGYGCGAFFQRCLQNIHNVLDNVNILQMIVTRFFGEHWQLDIHKHAKHVTKRDSNEVYERTSFMQYMSPGRSGKVIVYYDLTEEHEAASVIQACFRGWQARRDYRFNPHTRLGRYLVLRLGEFI